MAPQMEQNITIRIADVSPISTRIPAETEELVRRAEHNVNKVWNAWRNTYTARDSKEIIAMVAFQFAKSYYQLLEQVDRQKSILDDFETELNRLLDLSPGS